MCGLYSNSRALGQTAGPAGSYRSDWGQGQPLPTVSHQVRPLERRKYMLKSLDQIETVNGSGTAGRLTFQDREALAEHADLKSMVELIKRMLTWESHERISPSAALRHPFVSMQQLRSAHETTRYYQLSLRSCRLSLQVEGKPPTPVVAASEEGPPYYRLAEEEEPVGLGSVAGSGSFFREEKAPGMQRAIDQLDDLSLQEAGHGLWGETPSALAPLKAAVAGLRVPDSGPEPILAFYGSRLVGRHKARKPPTGSKSDSNFSNLIRLSQASPEEEGPCRGSGWAEGEHRGASAKPPTIPKRDGDGPDVKDMTMDAEVSQVGRKGAGVLGSGVPTELGGGGEPGLGSPHTCCQQLAQSPTRTSPTSEHYQAPHANPHSGH